jgi:hypothetical protein
MWSQSASSLHEAFTIAVYLHASTFAVICVLSLDMGELCEVLYGPTLSINMFALNTAIFAKSNSIKLSINSHSTPCLITNHFNDTHDILI